MTSPGRISQPPTGAQWTGSERMNPSSMFAASNGEGYELQMGRWSRRLAPPFVNFAGIAHAERVLDIGCGTGSLSFTLAESGQVGAVHGVDCVPAYVEYATSRCRGSKLTFEVADARALPFDDAHFDHAFSMLVLQFIPEPEHAIREMRRVTRSGGTAAAATWDTGGGLLAYRIVFDTAALLDPDGEAVRAKAYGRRFRRAGELAGAWRDAGFVDVVEDMLTIRMDFASFADFWRPAEGGDGPIAEHVSLLASDARCRLRRMVELSYLEGEIDGPRSFAATAWVVKGRVP